MLGYSFKAWWCGLAPPIVATWAAGVSVGIALVILVIAAIIVRRKVIG